MFDLLATVWVLLPKVLIQKDINLGAREMAQPLKAWAALAEELGSVSYIYMVALTTICNSSYKWAQVLF